MCVTTAKDIADAIRNINICTDERTVLLRCDPHKHIFVCFEMLLCESELNQKDFLSQFAVAEHNKQSTGLKTPSIYFNTKMISVICRLRLSYSTSIVQLIAQFF